jgi:GntR family transcriptional regulator, rspAB operon transcriptional repressor
MSQAGHAVMTSGEATAQAPPRAASQVYDHLRQEIVDLRLKPGSLISRAELQERFGLSSTPVRDALMRLCEEGLVEIVAQSATRVSLIDVDRARRAQFLRRALEQEAVETICTSADRTVVHELRARMEDQATAAAQGDLALFEEIDRVFHRHLFEAAGVADLHAMMRRQSGHIDRLRLLHLPKVGRMQEIMADHGAIVAAVKAGDAPAARAAVRDHLSRSLAYSPRLRELHPDYFKP